MSLWHFLWILPLVSIVAGILYARVRPLTLEERASVLAVETFERHFAKFDHSGHKQPLGYYRLNDLTIRLWTNFSGEERATITMGDEALPVWGSLQTRLIEQAQRPVILKKEADLAASAKNLAEMVIKLEQAL